MPKVNLTEEQVVLTIQAVASVLEALQHDLKHLEEQGGTIDDLFVMMELQIRFADLWVTLQEAAGVPSEVIRDHFRDN